MRVNVRVRDSATSVASSSPAANALGMKREGGGTIPLGAGTLQTTVRVVAGDDDDEEESDEEADAAAAAAMASRLSTLAFARSTLRGAATAAGVTVAGGTHVTSATQTVVIRTVEEESEEEEEEYVEAEEAEAARLASQMRGLSFAREALRGAGEESGLHGARDPLAQAGRSVGDGKWATGFGSSGGSSGPATMVGLPVPAGTDPRAVFAGLTQGASGMWEGELGEGEDDYYK
jgi:hypothetical protein